MLSEVDREAVTRDITDAIATAMIPAYAQLMAFIEDDYVHLCRESVGIGAVRSGQMLYESLAYLNTTVRTKPDDIHETGLSEVARIREAMAKVQKEIGFEGSLDDFLKHMRSDPKYRFTSREELISAADAILQRAKKDMPKLFNKLPKADCVMKEIESFRAPAAPVGYYNPTPEDGSRPGYYYINTHKPEERLRFTLEALSYHEAVPGHHLQMALDQENKNLPRFRRYGSYTAYIEGWALYTEKLGYEIGGYATPQDRFGQLTFEMWRACRLVVDTGMHYKGWTRLQAIDFMAKNTSLALVDIENEIDRYISWPGQALGYKIGELRILQLRKEAEEKLGPKFDLRAFHDALLAGGAMPIDILEKRMREWINAGS
jgi:prolyl oligopeptidase